MVGIVIVSHSAKLAAAVQELALQMIQGQEFSTPPPGNFLAIAAGIEDPDNPFGTNPLQVYEAIESVYSEDGVLVLMDLGSAVLSAEMALEFLSEAQRAQVKLCAAPLVEGAIAAVVQAALGASLDQVMMEAQGSLRAKQSHLSQAISVNQSLSATTATDLSTQELRELELTIQNPMGLHARPAAKFVAIASQFQSEIQAKNITLNSKFVNAKSITQVATLGVQQGHTIAIAARGVDATAALTALEQWGKANFHDTGPLDVIPASAQRCISEHQFSGLPVSGGVAVGPLFKYESAAIALQPQPVQNPGQEWQQFQAAVEIVRDRTQLLRDRIASGAGEAAAEIFDAYLLCLSDPSLIEQTQRNIFEHHQSAAIAWTVAIDATVASYEALEDSYLQARSTDIRDVGNQVLQALIGKQTITIHLATPAILVATELTPSETAQLDFSQILGICTVLGTATSHSAILARSLGIPAVTGVSADLLQLENGTLIALDGETGEISIHPDVAELQVMIAKQHQQETAAIALQQVAQQPAITVDGKRISVMANLGSLADARMAVSAGAEGAGLLRSEFLYLNRAIAPTEAEQVEVYSAIAQTLAPDPLIIRVLDIGADKPVPYLNLPPEANPSLGERGIRALLSHPDLLKTQLRAILRVSHDYAIKVMFPMITTLEEIRALKVIFAAVQRELQAAGIPFNETIEMGIMVEVPGTVAIAQHLAAEVDFFSIGTNDLTQYLMAADRTNPKVAPLADGFAPAVVKAIAQTVDAAHQAGIWVGVCGEMAASTLATPLLVGLGVDELSMNAAAIGAVKAKIAEITTHEAEAIAAHVLQLNSAAAVREFLALQ